MAILSNGSHRTLKSEAGENGPLYLIEDIISVDWVKTYKPSHSASAITAGFLAFRLKKYSSSRRTRSTLPVPSHLAARVCRRNPPQGHIEHPGFPADFMLNRLEAKSPTISDSGLSLEWNIQGQQQYRVMMSNIPGRFAKEMFPRGVTPRGAAANEPQMESCLKENIVSRPSFADLDRWMERYQQADPEAPSALVGALSPALLGFFRSQMASREQADDLLQETWLRIHRVRHSYRPGEPVLPWIYAIARRVRVDGYRRSRRVTLHETAMELLPERPAPAEARNRVPSFETLVAALPDAQREVVTMLKVGGLTLEEVARATSSTVGAVKQKAHRAYERLRKLLPIEAEETAKGAAQ